MSRWRSATTPAPDAPVFITTGGHGGPAALLLLAVQVVERLLQRGVLGDAAAACDSTHVERVVERLAERADVVGRGAARLPAAVGRSWARCARWRRRGQRPAAPPSCARRTRPPAAGARATSCRCLPPPGSGPADRRRRSRRDRTRAGARCSAPSARPRHSRSAGGYSPRPAPRRAVCRRRVDLSKPAGSTEGSRLPSQHLPEGRRDFVGSPAAGCSRPR